MAHDTLGHVPARYLVGAQDLNVTNAVLPIAVTRSGAKDRTAFAADIAAVRAGFAGADPVCILLEDRYQFTVALAAALLNRQRIVFPPSRAPEAIAAALGGAANAFVLDDASAYDALTGRADADGSDFAIGPDALGPALAAGGGRIEVFTSGSTGFPVSHRKSWAMLAAGASVTEDIFAAANLAGERFAIVATTPPQHMYGLEATVFTALAHGRCFYAGTVFYPEDLAFAAERLGAAGIERIVLVSSPPHLRFLEDAVAALPAVSVVISATSPLSSALAERLEAGGTRPVFEIYGSTETGSMAIRRTLAGDDWAVRAGFRFDTHADGIYASAPHLPERVLLGDDLSVEPGNRIRLIGRRGDTVHIAGKRSSLGALNMAVSEAPGIADAVVAREPGGTGDDALRIVAVRDPASPLSDTEARAAIRRHMLRHVDPVFVPRKIVFVPSLPRSATGKLTAAALKALAQRDAL